MTPGDAERRVAEVLERNLADVLPAPKLAAEWLAPRVLTAIRAGVQEYANLLRTYPGEMSEAEVDAHTVAAGVRALAAPVAETRPDP